MVIQSNFDILLSHKAILATQCKVFMCLRNKSHLNTLKLSAKYSYLSTHLCEQTYDRGYTFMPSSTSGRGHKKNNILTVKTTGSLFPSRGDRKETKNYQSIKETRPQTS